ncbi:MAG: hypothetical protein LDLANPLL_00985 [Turneriella sp.]|nr:hypothetical protein [Turneriella sp.]
MSREFYTDADVANFKECQSLAYDAVVAVQKRLKVGTTEKEAAAMIDEEIKARGMTRYFHAPFAWFGERTAFKGFERPLNLGNFPKSFLPPHFGLKFLPTNTRLEEGMCVILDVAPIYNDASADIGYAFAFGKNDAIEKALDDLAVFRPLILAGVCKEKTMAEIYDDVSEAINDMGYTNCHAKYPQGVLGHKVGKIPTGLIPRIPFMRFELSTFLYLGVEELSRLLNPWDNHTALWSDYTRVSADPGLWAVEPHIGMAYGGAEAGGAKETFGVKWEEILHVTENNAYYLDDNLPHVNRWIKREIAV